jgi:hypothetical protein
VHRRRPRHRRVAGKSLSRQASSSFLKKRTKKLLFTAGFGFDGATPRRNKSFFASFFSKKEALS